MDNKVTDSSIVTQMNEHFEKQCHEIERKLQNRRNFGKLVHKYYRERLGIEPGKGALSKLAEKHTVLIEASHGAQLPHLGIFRLYVKGGDIARKLGSGLLLFFAGDQYSPDMYPEMNKIKVPFTGKAREKTLVIPVENKRMPVRLLRPPAEKDIRAIGNKMMGSFGDNLNYFISLYGLSKNDIDREIFKRSLNEAIGMMVESAKAVKTYGDWCVRVQLEILKRTNPDLYEDHVLFYPVWDLRELSPSWQALMGMQREINAFESKIGKNEGGGTDPNESRLWYYCDCGARARSTLKGENKVSCTCSHCGKNFKKDIDDLGSAPDIVFSQVLTPVHLGITGRVVGHIHPYAAVADGFVKENLLALPPKRFVLSSYPTFHGIGDPKEGDSRCSLIRAAIESEYSDIGIALTKDWSENQHIYSYFNSMDKKVGK